MNDFTHLRDVVGQLPFLKTYSHLLLAFPLQDDITSRNETVERLRSAVLKLTEALPWLAAKVISKGNGAGASGLFELESCALWSPPNTILRIRDCSRLCTPYDKLIEARGPATMLDGSMLGPRKAFPESYQETEEDPAPVLAFQANLIQGGLLLDCAAQHNFIDMSGIEQCYNLLAAAMSNEPFPPDSVEQGNLDRRNLVPLLRPDEPMLDHSHFKRPLPSDLPPPPLEPNSPFSWRYFRFSAAKLSELKSLATSPEACDLLVPYISTNDALTAFCWQCVISVRLRRRQTPRAIAKFCRAVDARKVMGVPRGYMGDLVTIATSRISFQELADASLPTVANLLRGDLNAVNTRDYVRSFATFIANTSDKSTIVYGGNFNPDTDIGSSSWAHVQLSRVNFGHLGKPTLVRRPNFQPLRSDIYFMPKTDSGDIDALLCFNEEDMMGLMADSRWNSFADYIG
ncbi:transferase family-domain-containing protein [Biscogniauxia marginata]|nr:transferase family-domain-containing protein [Biscogniauxia marginata]